MVSEVMKDLIIFRDRSYNFHPEENSFVQSEVKATYYGLPSISHLAPRIWHQIPYGIRNCRSRKDFKKAIKGWTHCRLCKTYLSSKDSCDHSLRSFSCLCFF